MLVVVTIIILSNNYVQFLSGNEKPTIVTLVSKLNAVSGRSGQGSPHLQVPVVCRYSLNCGRLLSAVPLGLKEIVVISSTCLCRLLSPCLGWAEKSVGFCH